jgi:hypothetical protein
MINYKGTAQPMLVFVKLMKLRMVILCQQHGSPISFPGVSCSKSARETIIGYCANQFPFFMHMNSFVQTLIFCNNSTYNEYSPSNVYFTEWLCTLISDIF